MKEIISEYRKTHRLSLIINWVITALCIVGFVLAGSFRRSAFSACILSAGIASLSLLYTAQFIVQPLIFKRKVSKAGEAVAAALKEKPSKFPARFFFGDIVVFFSNWQIKFADCKQISSAELLRSKVKLTLKDEQTLNMPFTADENPALLCAVLRSLNGDIDFIVCGKHIPKADDEDKNNPPKGDNL